MFVGFFGRTDSQTHSQTNTWTDKPDYRMPPVPLFDDNGGKKHRKTYDILRSHSHTGKVPQKPNKVNVWLNDQMRKQKCHLVANETNFCELRLS